ncbi:hypothetical protein [Spongiactinospora sp. TRM90649]|uniref:hypothetical protein n=1 Tax=Spongiactinospora sp. TRM90649 TaxID=3031114 RepID=UPI0023F7E38D|nr:hypothetical protein [Spongiactinospora sp. TRM90649]MDF5754394.1 hypothetical protein [Spongiactinospora sp. TRM90649]
MRRWVKEHGYDIDLAQITACLGELREHGLVFVDGDTYVALATSSAAQRAHHEAVVAL